MPKKVASWGMQEYVPAGNGDASGEYADEGGQNIHHVFDPENFGRGKGKKTEGRNKEQNNDENIKTSERKELGKDFKEYLKSSFEEGKGVTAEGLQRQFDTGSDDAKSIINNLIKNGTKFRAISGRDNADERIIELSRDAVRENPLMRNEGEIFYHESFHAVDGYLAQFVSEEDKNEARQSLLSKKAKSLLSNANFDAFRCDRTATSCKKLSNGKTLYQTLVEEAKKKGLEGFRQIANDYYDEIDSELKKEIGFTRNELQQKLNEVRKKCEEQAKKEGFKEYTREFWDKVNQLQDADEEYKNLREKEKTKKSLSDRVGKKWIGISDTCEGSGYVEFHGGHGSSYWNSNTQKGTKLHRGMEFIAEYCSAYSRKDTNGKEEIALFEKYFPETSKCARELFEMALKKAKGEK